MAILINEISEKYINKLGKNHLNTVKLSEAASSIRKAVEETAEAAKDEIKGAVEPLKTKIAQKDEFIASQTKNNEELKKENEELKQSVKTLKQELDDHRLIIREAYKQNITQEIRDKKNTLASILSGLLHNKEVKKETNIKIAAKKAEETVIQKTEKTQKIKKQNRIKPHTITPEIIKEIESQRKNQKLDNERLNTARVLIKFLLENAPQKDTHSGIQEQFKKTMDKYVKTVNRFIHNRIFEIDKYGKIRVGTDSNGKVLLKERGTDFDGQFHPYKYEIFNQDGSSVEINDMLSDSHITFRDIEGKKLLKICYNDNFSIFISDKNERLMVAETVKDGVVKYLNVNFNDVKPIEKLKNDEQMNIYAKNLISKAKAGCKPTEKTHSDTTDIDYINPEGKRTVCEYYVNKKKVSTPVFTYLFSPTDESLKKLISNCDFGMHGKLVDNGFGGLKLLQYRTEGITSIDKRRKNACEMKDFHIGLYKSTDNEHFETHSLYDEKYESDKDSFLQRAVYEKRNYGTAAHPVTKAFTFNDLSKHQIKPWDFRILKPYF